MAAEVAPSLSGLGYTAAASGIDDQRLRLATENLMVRELTALSTVGSAIPVVAISAGVLQQRAAQQAAADEAGTGGPMGSGCEVLLQGFNWESCRAGVGGGTSWYRQLEAKACAIAEAGVTCVWLPPPSQSVSREGYLPRELECLDSAYGSEAELRSLIAALHKAGLKVMADVVINHRCATEQSPEGVWNEYGGRYNWDASCIVANSAEYCGRGSRKAEQLFEPAPNVDHANPRVRADLKGWLQMLRSAGFDGWRFDFAKGYSGQYVEEYIRASRPAVAVGEYWDDCAYSGGPGSTLDYDQDAHRQRIVDWCDSTAGTSAAFDFTTKGILQEALARREYWRLRDREGKAPGVVGWWPSRAVTFLENHDTGSTQQNWPFPSRHLAQGYAYTLTHPGTPCVFYDHLFGDGRPRSLADCLQQRLGCMGGAGGGKYSALGGVISRLLDLRRRNGINCRSQLEICEANGEVYAAVVDGRVAVRIGPGGWSPPLRGRLWRLTVSGVHYSVWEAAGADGMGKDSSSSGVAHGVRAAPVVPAVHSVSNGYHALSPGPRAGGARSQAYPRGAGFARGALGSDATLTAAAAAASHASSRRRSHDSQCPLTCPSVGSAGATPW